MLLPTSGTEKGAVAFVVTYAPALLGETTYTLSGYSNLRLHGIVSVIDKVA